MKRFFNKKRDNIHYRRFRLNAKEIKFLIIMEIHTNRNDKIIILNIDLFITNFDTLNCNNTRNRTKNCKMINTYLNARLNQYFKVFKNDNSVKNNDKNTNLNENLYAVINDEKFDKK